MRTRTVKIIVAAVLAVGVIGAGAAVAADPSACPYGNTPQANQGARANCNGDQAGQQLRKRDGTGPRHAQSGARKGHRHGYRQGAGQGNRGADCPYRS